MYFLKVIPFAFDILSFDNVYSCKPFKLQTFQGNIAMDIYCQVHLTEAAINYI